MLDAPRDSSTRLKMLEIRFVVHPMCVVFEALGLLADGFVLYLVAPAVNWCG